MVTNTLKVVTVREKDSLWINQLWLILFSKLYTFLSVFVHILALCFGSIMISFWKLDDREVYFISNFVFLFLSCSFSLSKRPADVKVRQAGLSHIIRVLQFDAVGLRGTEMVWSTSTWTAIILVPVESMGRFKVRREVMRGPMILLCWPFFYSSSACLGLIT